MNDTTKLRELAEAAKGRWHPNELHSALSPYKVIALLDEIESLRCDAERYRWLRDKHTSGIYVTRFIGRPPTGVFDGEFLDECLDKAMEAEHE